MRIILSLILACFAIYGYSQTVVWQMKPTDYSQIERISSNLFRVVRNGRIGLINSDGTVVAAVINDNISDFYEHKALITCNDGYGERITGCLTDNGMYYNYATKYYTLNGQKFFSDGLLSVSDENDKRGYIDERGNKVIGFDGKYSRIKPFTEGYAAVQNSKKRYVLINKDGNEMTFNYKDGIGRANIVGCTNVYEGKSYVWDEYTRDERSYFIYDAVRKSNVEKTKRVKNTDMDYLYCYQWVTGRPKEVPFEKMKSYSGNKGLSATSTNGLYGYISNDNVIVPEQFSSASQFEDGMAIVSLNGEMGILKFVDGASFGVSVPTIKHDFYAGNSVSCNFNLSVPSIWHERKLDVVLRDMDGSVVPTTNTSDTYTFSVKPSFSGQVEFSVIVSADGLRLYESKIVYLFNKRERCNTCGKDKNLCEYKGQHPIPAKKQDQKQNPCPTCGKSNCKTHCYHCRKTIVECEYNGVHVFK